MKTKGIMKRPCCIKHVIKLKYRIKIPEGFLGCETRSMYVLS